LSSRFQAIGVPALVLAGAAALYLPQLRDAPNYLGRDEMFFGLTAHSLATTGRDTNGRFLPLYFQTQMRYGSEMWFQPLLMYAAAGTVKAFGLSEGTIRLPMALSGIVDVVLVYFIGRLLFERRIVAIAAAALLALSPAHFINSRVAMDFQAPLPFVLGWLLCVLMYLRRRSSGWLFSAGLLLGLGLFTYIAADMLMPIYALLTGVVLYQQREAARRYLALAAGFIIPASIALPFLWFHPTVFHDVLWHYERERPPATGAIDLAASFLRLDRLAHAASVYLRFWMPRFLFVDGPQSEWVAGAFLLAMAGLLIVGLIHALRTRATWTPLLIGGLLTSPIPASLVGDTDAIHRAAEVLPFGVLLAAVGMDALWDERSLRAQTIGFASVWIVPICLAVIYHDQLPLAQAIIRASSVPLLLVGLFLMFEYGSVGWSDLVRLTAIAWLTVAACQIGYLAFGYATVAWACAIVFVSVLTAYVLRGSPDRPIPSALIVIGLAAASSHFMYAYVEPTGIQRVRFVPASVIAAMVRFLTASAAPTGIVAGSVLLKRIVVDRLSRHAVLAMAAVAIVAIQFAYFHIDYFSRFGLRFVHSAAILAVAVAGAMVVAKSSAAARVGLGYLSVIAVAGAASLQFAYFYGDYFTRYRDRSGALDPEGNARVAWELVIERARHRSIPALYLGGIGPYGFGDLYWTFYAIKHDRLDLLARTISDVGLEADRIRHLPDASLVVTSPSPERDRLIAGMVSAGTLRDRTLVSAPDGASKFWILETGARAEAVRP
jgi:4-amino-4-deoxy-L-arabinose transferase-like glycosyltransferase